MPVLARPSPTARRFIAAAAVLACAGCLLLTRRQVRAWENSVALYEHSIARGEDNAAVRYLLAGALRAAGRPEAEYSAQYRRALVDQPDYINALTQLAGISLQAGRTGEARQLIERSIRLEPQNASVYINLGAYYVRLGRPNEAVPQFERALRLDPVSVGAHYELALIYMAQNRPEAALAHFEALARILPWDAEKLCDYGTVLGNLRRLEEARRILERALWIKPDYPRARENLRAVQGLMAGEAVRRRRGDTVEK